MKTKLLLRLQAFWQALTEIPGWPDAPLSLRIRRVLPIAIPAFAFLALVFLQLVWVQPRVRAERAAHAPILALVEEVEALRAVSPEADAAAAAERAASAAQMLLENPSQAPAELAQLQRLAETHGWQAQFHALPFVADETAAGEGIAFVTARGKLTAQSDNASPFASLISLVEQLSSSSKRIDLTRLTVRADEGGRHSVELSLRLGCRPQP